ncbi:hypothetical protein QL285_080313 [Trifolium repens]|nr:hypothetical protein QL285_080313 [Trifolium repens]
MTPSEESFIPRDWMEMIGNRRSWFLVSNTKVGLRGVFKTQKLYPRYIGPYRILRSVDSAAYQLALSPSMSGLHDVFRVSQLRKYIPDPYQPIESNRLISARSDLSAESKSELWNVMLRSFGTREFLSPKLNGLGHLMENSLRD